MSFKIKGAEGKSIAIEDGHYYFNTKARARRMMLNSLSNDARRVYACLELATMGFQQELAVVAIGQEKRRPMNTGDIASQTGLRKQHVSRALAELEAEGLVERRSDDKGPLRSGHIHLYSWSEPRVPKARGVTARGYTPPWFPESWEPLKPLLNRFKYKLTPDEVIARGYFEEGARVARDYQNAELVAARFLKGLRARVPLNKEERTERTVERTEALPDPPASPLYKDHPQSSSSAVRPSSGVLDHQRKSKAEEEEESALYQIFKSVYPAGHFDGAKAKPLFDGKRKAEQLAAIERLRVFLKCDRWKDEDGRWIPLASTWLQSAYTEEPPPLVVKKKAKAAGSSEESYFERRAREDREASNG